jgi:hypothetical protein
MIAKNQMIREKKFEVIGEVRVREESRIMVIIV